MDINAKLKQRLEVFDKIDKLAYKSILFFHKINKFHLVILLFFYSK